MIVLFLFFVILNVVKNLKSVSLCNQILRIAQDDTIIVLTRCEGLLHNPLNSFQCFGQLVFLGTK